MQLSENISTIVADITTLDCEAIVNAANSSLLGGGGVDGAIHRAGGPVILKECRDIRNSTYPDGLPTGEAVLTTAGNMPSSYVIHTVGPIYSSSKEQSGLLGNCYKNSIKKAAEKGCSCIAFPAISTGIYGYPKDEAAKIAYSSVKEALKVCKIEVLFVFSRRQNEEIFLKSIS